MALSEDQKMGIELSLISFLLLVALLVANDRYHWCAAIVLVLGVVLVAAAIWGLAMATTSPDSEESTEFNFRRYLAAFRGVRILSQREIEEIEQSRNAIDLDDPDRIDKL